MVGGCLVAWLMCGYVVDWSTERDRENHSQFTYRERCFLVAKI